MAMSAMHVEPEVLPPERKPDMAALRAIAAGVGVRALPLQPVAAADPLAICGHEEEDRDTGQWGRCRRFAGHKGNCGNWEVFDRVG